MIKEAIIKIVDKQDLTYDEAYTVINEIMSGETTQTQNAAFLAALSTKSTKAETIDEISGCAAAMRDHATKVIDPSTIAFFSFIIAHQTYNSSLQFITTENHCYDFTLPEITFLQYSISFFVCSSASASGFSIRKPQTLSNFFPRCISLRPGEQHMQFLQGCTFAHINSLNLL